MIAIEQVRVYAKHEDWLAARAELGVCGASEIAGMLGVHPQLTAWGIWEKAHGRKPDEGIVEVFARGHRWESAVLAEYADESGCDIIEPGSLWSAAGKLITIAHRDHDWLRMSPDAFACAKGQRPTPTGGFWGVEAKTAMHAHAWSPDQGVVIASWDDTYASLIPPQYAVQCYTQLACSGLPWVDACALVPDHGWLAVRWVRIMRDESTQDAIVAAAAEWRERHLIQGIEPDIDGSRECSRFLAAKFPRVGKSLPERPATAAERERIESLVSLRRTAKRTKLAVATLANELANSAEGHRLMLGTGKGAPYAMPIVGKGRTSIDSVRLRRDFPEAARLCAKQGLPSVQFRAYRMGDDEDDNDNESEG